MSFEFIFDKLMFLLVLTPVIILHELGHAWVALKFGDNTAKLDGRITLNPLKHLDLTGTIMLLVAGFGWAKPVMINPNNFKNPRRDMAIVALAGPVVNFILAIIMVFVLVIVSRIGVVVLIDYILLVVRMSLVLGVFNLIPIPPLDGSKIVGLLLPQGKAYDTYVSGGTWSFILLIVLLFTGVIGRILLPTVNFIMDYLIKIVIYV